METSPDRKSDRKAWGDIAKGVGILAIVTSHVVVHDKTLPSATYKMVMGLVTMPTFFVLSGMMFRPGEIGSFFVRRVRSIAVPYFAFLLLVTLLVAARDILLPNPSMPHLWQFLWGGEELKGDFGTFWFLSTLFFTQLLYNLVASRHPDPIGLPLVLLAAGLLLGGTALDQLAKGWALPWSLHLLPYTVPLFWFGHLLQREQQHRTLIYAGLAVIGVVALVALSQGAHFWIAMKGRQIEPPVIGLLVGFVTAKLAISVYRLTASVPGISHALGFAGKRSLVILCLHQFVHFSLRRVGVETTWILILFAFTLPACSVIAFERFAWSRAIFLGRTKPRRNVEAGSGPAIPVAAA